MTNFFGGRERRGGGKGFKSTAGDTPKLACRSAQRCPVSQHTKMNVAAVWLSLLQVDI